MIPNWYAVMCKRISMRQGDGVLHIFKEKYFNTKRGHEHSAPAFFFLFYTNVNPWRRESRKFSVALSLFYLHTIRGNEYVHWQWRRSVREKDNAARFSRKKVCMDFFFVFQGWPFSSLFPTGTQRHPAPQSEAVTVMSEPCKNILISHLISPSALKYDLRAGKHAASATG